MLLALAMEESVGTTSSGNSFSPLSMTSMANARSTEISWLQGQRPASPAPEDRPSSCRSASPWGRQDLFTFVIRPGMLHIRHFLNTWRGSHDRSHPWKQKEVDDIFMFGHRSAEVLGFHHLLGSCFVWAALTRESVLRVRS